MSSSSSVRAGTCNLVGSHECRRRGTRGGPPLSSKRIGMAKAIEGRREVAAQALAPAAQAAMAVHELVGSDRGLRVKVAQLHRRELADPQLGVVERFREQLDARGAHRSVGPHELRRSCDAGRGAARDREAAPRLPRP